MLNEVVYADKTKINTRKKTIGLSYVHGKRAANNANFNDKLGTEEMDQDNANTIEVPLKGGLISYNITDIKGVEVMHYFKKKWGSGQRATMDVIDQEGNKDAYDLQMDNSEERKFIDRFVKKVEYVVRAWVNKHQKANTEFSHIAILPVDSTSCFNKNFVRAELRNIKIGSLSCKVVDPEILVKDLKNVQRDEEFITKNRAFYNGNYASNHPEMGTVTQRIDDVIVQNQALNIVNEKIQQINYVAQKLLNFLSNNKDLTEFSTVQARNLKQAYKKYVDLIRECYNITYTGVIDNKVHTFNNNEILQAIKYSKGPSIDSRSNLLWQLVKPLVRNEKSPIDGKSYIQMPLCMWKKTDFQIKTLRNSERLGLQNIYAINDKLTNEKIQEEVNKMHGAILLIFDDNISGGATLSDVCYQCQKLGAKNIIPITFGKMSEANSLGNVILNTPENGYDFSTNNNLSVYTGPEKVKRSYVKKGDRLNSGRELFYKVFKYNPELPVINILWLDDVREPYSYFVTERQSGAWARNSKYYTNNIFNHYNPNFIWVKNFDEFKEYILSHEMPDMVSFDHDIRPRNYFGPHETGADVAQWFVNYCKKNHLSLPHSITHSANKSGAEHIVDILSSAQQVHESNEFNNKSIIKINENQLRQIIIEAVKQIVKNETNFID